MSLESAMQRLDAAWENPEGTARKMHADGCKVVGFLGATVPVELIAASGAYPFRLKGSAPGVDYGATDLSDTLMEPVRETYLRQLFDRMLKGDLEWIDLLVIPRTSEGLLQLYYLIDYARSLDIGQRMPRVYLLDLLQTQHDYSIRYNRKVLSDFAERLGEITGTLPDEAAITLEIAATNETRRAFRDLCTSGKLTGIQRLKLSAFGQHEPRAEFKALIGEFQKAEPKAVSKAIALSGSTQENAAVYDAFAAHGVDIAIEDHDWGAAIYEHDASLEDDPIAALEARYRVHGLSLRQFVRRQPELGVDGKPTQISAVAFFFEENDDTLGWEYPDEKTRLERVNLKSIVLRGPVGSEACQKAISDFAAQLPVRAGGTAND
ncbi:2-hydroxyacyl-CoA dehydratase family protein [Aquamicrobium zhengzhouense]|uniref:2-hydroxyacyl-CoA dehydratase n=1 Tax=Aquamicrobium zhengzhouense TaxID=2781738 RepID=A0ABS0SD54_9HYPH|nr:2-hydroxyacyl-CoA dehydratase family protein [Aquamicrobium zhengzhouense]MBI1621229.1 2-hydroxyacyl-CoA dehydratase [Aquamicrobium zhengzhouense]